METPSFKPFPVGKIPDFFRWKSPIFFFQVVPVTTVEISGITDSLHSGIFVELLELRLRSPALMPFKDTAAKVRNGRKLSGCGHLYDGYKRTDRCFTYQMQYGMHLKNQQKDTAPEVFCCQSLDSQKAFSAKF